MTKTILVTRGKGMFHTFRDIYHFSCYSRVTGEREVYSLIYDNDFEKNLDFLRSICDDVVLISKFVDGKENCYD